MSDTMFIEKCQTYIDCHLQAPKGGFPHSTESRLTPSVTISRQTGAGGIAVANQLAAWLQRRAPKGRAPWTVFHKNLVQRVLEDHNLPARLAQFMPEDRVSAIEDAMEELLGLHPPSLSLMHQTTETILRLAELGNVILVGRGANIITARLAQVVHVRLVGSTERRAERVMEGHKISRKAALAFLAKEDAGRRRYLRKNFNEEVDNPLLFHLTLNTDLVPLDEATEIIGQMVLRKYPPAG